MPAPRPRLDTQARRRAGGAVALFLGLSLIAAALSGGGALGPTVTAAAPAASDGRPNVVVIETDDQTLGSMKVMSAAQARIAERGVTFRDSFVNFSLCCPSRATFLTGQYAHNHRVLSNTAPRGGASRFESLHADNNLALWLSGAGYRTALIGKYLNGYFMNPIEPPGWSEWQVGIGGAVYDYDLNENGEIVHYGTRANDFKPDVLTRKAVEFIRTSAPDPEPFFLWLTYGSPHTNPPDPNPQPPSDCHAAAKPAPRDADAFTSERLPRPPNFNEADVSDKPEAIRDLPSLSGSEIAELERKYQCALESLLAVDRGTDRVLTTLKRSGELPDSYVIYTSDNGFFNGAHRIAAGKILPYEESIRVPLVIRGPGIPAGRTARDLAINADLAPTIVRASGAEPGLRMDGRSLLPVASNPRVERGRELAIESTKFDAIRTQRYIYIEHRTGERELYDLHRDRYELRNAVGDPAYAAIGSALAARLRGLQGCASDACRRAPHLSLRLDYRLDHRNGRRCARNPIRARIDGPEAAAAVEAEFSVGGVPVAADTEPPLRRALPPFHELARVQARAAMIDGRRVTLARRVRACG